MNEEPRLREEVADLVRRILRLPDSAPLRDRVDATEWDSLKHMEVVFALEDRYGIQFDESEFEALDSLDAIAAAVQRHRAT